MDIDVNSLEVVEKISKLINTLRPEGDKIETVIMGIVSLGYDLK